MRSLNNVLVVHRNETFTIDKLIVNRDGSPYIVSNNNEVLNNPYWLISVSSSKYAQEGRYLESWWLSLANFPRFKYTNPVDLHAFKTALNVPAFATFEDVRSLNNFIHTYYNGEQVTSIAPDDFVFYLDTADGRIYKHWSVIASNWKDYECRITMLFPQETTTKWVEQSYVYSINLVAGTDMLTTLRQYCISWNIYYTNDMTAEDLYMVLKSKGFEFPGDFQYTDALGQFDLVKPILIPTELRVMSDIKGGVHG